MENERYPDQLLRVLRQMRDRAVEDRADPKLRGMLSEAVAIATGWNKSRRPPPPPPGVGFVGTAEVTGRAAEAARLDEELKGALIAIHPDFLPEAIDNSIRVAGSQDC